MLIFKCGLITLLQNSNLEKVQEGAHCKEIVVYSTFCLNIFGDIIFQGEERWVKDTCS